MKWHYFVLLVGWAGPLIALQWVVGRRTFDKNLRAVLPRLRLRGRPQRHLVF